MGFIDISGESVELTEVDKIRVVDKDGWMSEYENIRSLSYDKDYEEVDIILNGDTEMIVHEGVVHLYLKTGGHRLHRRLTQSWYIKFSRGVCEKQSRY